MLRKAAVKNNCIRDREINRKMGCGNPMRTRESALDISFLSYRSNSVTIRLYASTYPSTSA
jgi:hypothetical protein